MPPSRLRRYGEARRSSPAMRASGGGKACATRGGFVPPYVGPSEWVGVWLDAKTDWKELANILRDAYKLAAPQELIEQLVNS